MIDYSKIKAHPTTYNGIRFRSRLEATWAAFFDLLGWRWEYEPFDLGKWSPDFLIHGRWRDVLVEVKPISAPDVDVMKKISDAAPSNYCLFLCGVSPCSEKWSERYNNISLFSSCCGCARQACWMRRHFVRFGDAYDIVFGHQKFHPGFFTGIEANACDAIQEYVGDEVEGFWAAAKNITQWRAPR